MKMSLLFVWAVFLAGEAFGQTSSGSGQTPPGIVAPSTNQRITSVSTNRFELGNLSFTNSTGTAYSADQLAARLQELRAAVDQAMPVIAAFNESFSNSSHSIKGTVTDLLSGVLNRGTNRVTSSESPGVSNLVANLQKLLTTNSTGSVAVSANLTKDLSTLQAQLQQIDLTLQSLNVAATTNPASGSTIQPLTPTGR